MVDAQPKELLRTSRDGRKLDPSWTDASRRRQDVASLLSGKRDFSRLRSLNL